MINLLKGEFYKLFKSRAFYVCTAIAVFTVILVYGMLVMADGIQSGELDNGTGGVVVESSQENEPPILEQMTNAGVLQQVYASFGAFIIVSFVSIFVIGEYTNGAVKNVVGKGYPRWKIFAAKYISALTATIILMIVMAVVNLICGMILLKGQTVDQAFFINLLQFTGIELLLGAGLAGISILVSELCRTLGAGITIGIGIVTFSSVVTGLLDLAVKLVNPDSAFTFADYWVLDLLGSCPVEDINADFVIRAVLVGMAWLAAAAGLGLLHFKKADIK